ncbi:hypothetical protein OS242_17530 [Tumebacillus sp. DT12]|uniref:DUF1440 domain-containing protein n=1 Tax=Tumebacillus lacus TaxID=2995335 RepID=A0ABT3X6Y6_9BACL|nr:hypothetical protein [Tumebacillus lacus]MCX7571748.1 hypothetical protein [Tumebacillus lacus]
MLRLSVIGLVTGVLLGLLLVLLATATGDPLDVVLLDLSYIPVLSTFNTPIIQWLLHFLVAIIAAMAYRYIYLRVLPANFITGALYGLLTSLIYFVLQPLAAPELSGQLRPLVWWFAAHALYGVALHALTKFSFSRHNSFI